MWALPAGHWGMNAQRRFGSALCGMESGLGHLGLWEASSFKEMGPENSQTIYLLFCRWVVPCREVRVLSGRSCSFLPTTRVLPNEGRPDFTLRPDKSHFLFIGRYHRNKGPDVLLEAIHLIDRETLSKIQFHFFGAGPLERDLKRKVLQ